MEKKGMESENDVVCDLGITESALAEIQRVRVENKIPDTHGLRIGVNGGGCSGLSYILGFDDRKSENDTVMTINDISVIIDEQSRVFLSGAELDFQNNADGKGFIVNNPNAPKSCGCGNSSCND
jgi:iron-sulfur cluster assembly protein